MGSDIDNHYQPLYTFSYEIESDRSSTSEKIVENPKIGEGKTICQPKNPLQRSIHEFALNHIPCYSPVIALDIKKRLISANVDFPISFDGKAFAKYVKQDAAHQRDLNELKYIEERIETDKKEKDEILENPKININEQLKNIDIQRFDAA